LLGQARAAVRKAGLRKHAACHTLRHSFATHSLSNGYDVRALQELLGQRSVQATMIYVLKRGGFGVEVPRTSYEPVRRRGTIGDPTRPSASTRDETACAKR
jgi:integrase